MLHIMFAASSVSGTTGWLLVATTALTALGVVLGAAFGPIGERLTRRDQLKTYKRNVYRNFLDHAYWYRSDALSEDDRQKRAELYVADWHRIDLIGSSGVRTAIKLLQAPGSLTAANEEPVVKAFKDDLGLKGLG